ncbi:MAG TPA: endolytic transglycosylase MltG [Bacteroidales bacterium]|nr:endolytic transglycosylase MltG [Bacteroidales bacterium]
MADKDKKTRKPVWKIVLFTLLSLILLVGITGSYLAYQWILQPNVELQGSSSAFLCIPTGSDFNQVRRLLYSHAYIRDARSFEWVSQWKGYDKKVRPGRYRIREGMSNNDLVNLLRSGKQEPVRLVFNSLLRKEDLAGKISRQIEADSLTLLRLLNDPVFLRKYHTNPANAFLLFIPNTYEFYWNTPAEQFIDRMYREQQDFWNPARVRKCREEGLSPAQAVILASIVERETAVDAEKPVIAGVYLNRLRSNWPLQADPTLIYALDDYTIRRVLDKHKLTDSPYNTYLHTGLPPGPICLPSITSIVAVLNANGDGYMYFCARDDLSGSHVFAKTLAEHERNAKKYQEALHRLEQQKKYGS